MKKFIKIFDIVFSLLCVLIFTFVIIGNYTMPNSIVSYDGGTNNLSQVFSYSTGKATQSVDYQSQAPSKQTINLLGVIPVKQVNVTNKSAQQVYVSGEPFGIKLYTDGVIVVGTQAVDSDKGKVNPATKAGIQVGDIIISINNINVYTSTEVTNILNDNNGLDYKIKVKRDDRYKTFILKPVYSSHEGCYKAGMWVRDSTAGIGTITFYNQNTGTFAALGHQINDVDTNQIMPMLEGEAVNATVTSVQKGSSGVTGSLICDFSNYSIGLLLENTSCGIYGSYTSIPDFAKKYYVASKQEVKKGNAQILCTTDNSTPKLYNIDITHISYSNSGEKNIVFKVTDKNLISQTGGIVQGMSGSPIIQNGKLVGAVTHVIVSNPQKGYAIFAQTMFEESNNVE